MKFINWLRKLFHNCYSNLEKSNDRQGYLSYNDDGPQLPAILHYEKCKVCDKEYVRNWTRVTDDCKEEGSIN